MDVEEKRFYNFLKYYNFEKYHKHFSNLGVHKISHLKAVDDKDLVSIGMQRPEIFRFNKKIEENFSKVGRFKKMLARKDCTIDENTKPSKGGHNPTTPMHMIIKSEDLNLGAKLGEGAFGAVYTATLLQDEILLTVAVKKIYSQVKGPSAEEMFLKEIQSMAHLNHEHIIKLYGLVLGHPLMLVEELAPFGDLATYLKNQVVHLAMMHTYAMQLADAMQYLESQKVIHRDLATRNVLVISSNHVKISDFGLARRLKDDPVYNHTNFDVALPTAWLAPESLLKGEFSSASDVWSFGILLWEITSLGGRPWEGIKPVELHSKIISGQRLSKPTLCYPKFYELMMVCWATRPSERPSFYELCKLLQQQKYFPGEARVVKKYTTKQRIDLNKGDVLYLINQEGEGWWVGMTTTAKIVSFHESCITFQQTKNQDQVPAYSLAKDDITERYIGFNNSRGTKIDDEEDGENYLQIIPLKLVDTKSSNLSCPTNDPSMISTEFVSMTSIETEKDMEKDMKSMDSVDLPSPAYRTREALSVALHELTTSNTATPLSKKEHLEVKQEDTQSKSNPVTPHVTPKRKIHEFPGLISRKGSHPNLSTDTSPKITPMRPMTIFGTPTELSKYGTPDELRKLQDDFPDISIPSLEAALTSSQGNLESAIEEIKVEQLLQFKSYNDLDYISEKDCRRALQHCQGNVDRAGAWLLELNENKVKTPIVSL